MSEDLDGGLSVNFTVDKGKGEDGSQRKKNSITGNRGQRIKARKAIKRKEAFEKFKLKNATTTEESREKQSDTDSPSPKFTDNVKVADNVKVTDKAKMSGEAPHRPHGVISSLFTFNPEIPSMPRSSVKPVKETLFSSDSFKDVPLHPYMVSNLEKLGFMTMTSVQRETIPQLMDGQDVLVKSQTGSGKTMAYAIPIIEDLCRRTPKLQRQDGVHALVIVPTRELALQSYEVFQKLLKPFTWLVPSCLFGGEKRKSEKARLRKGINILIATPGRLLDHIQNTQNLLLGKLKWLILDEADRLLDLGFEAKVSEIVTAIDQQAPFRQTVLLSATLTAGVERLAGMSLKEPRRVSIQQSNKKGNTDKPSSPTSSATGGTEEEEPPPDDFAIPEGLKQQFVITPCKLRLVTLLTMVLTKCKKNSKVKMIVFLSTQDAVEFLYRLVHYLTADHSSSDVEEGDCESTSLNLYRLHGDMSQKDRTKMFQEYCSTKSGVLFCTDVAARGLHLPSVQWVVQYSCPTAVSDYVHRVGRTARAGGTGTSVLFVLPSEVNFVKHLNTQKIRVEELKMGEILKHSLKVLPLLPEPDPTKNQLPRTVEETATYLQTCCEHFVRGNKDASTIAKKAYQSYIRAYATYPTDLKYIFHVKHLHLGHVAKTFGLRDAPSNISGVQGAQMAKSSKKRKREEHIKRTQGIKRPRTDMSEFSGKPVFENVITKKMAKRNVINKRMAKRYKNKR